MNKILIILISVLIVWNVFLTAELNKNQNVNNENKSEVVVENYVNGFSTDLTKVVPNIQSSIVSIKTENSQASGVIVKQIENMVYVTTNYHAIEGSEIFLVQLDNFTSLSADLIGYDAISDVAVLGFKYNYDVKPINFGNSSLLKKGEFVLAIGSPISNEYRGSLSLGIISSANRIVDVFINEHSYFVNMIQSDVTLNDGNSGGALVNMAGDLIGLNTMILNIEDAKGMSFSIPSNELKLIVDEIIETGSATKVNLGLKVFPVSELKSYQKSNMNIALDQVKGLYVSDAKMDFTGYYLGIKPGDIILEINDHKMNNIDDLIMEEYSLDKHIGVSILRAGSLMNLEGEVGLSD